MIVGQKRRNAPPLTHQRKRAASSVPGESAGLAVMAACELGCCCGCGWRAGLRAAGGRGGGMLAARVAFCGAARVPAALLGPVSSRPYVAQAGSAVRAACPDSVQPGWGEERGTGRAAQGGSRGRAAAGDHAGSPSPSAGEDGLRAPVSRRAGFVPGQAASAASAGVQRPPEAATGSHPASCTAMSNPAHSEAAQATRAFAPAERTARRACAARADPGRARAADAAAASSAAAASAWYFAAMTGLWASSGKIIRQAAVRSAGRPRREMRDWPSNAPEELSAGDRPACLTSDDEVS